MNDSEMDIISIDELENDIPRRRNERFDFPAIYVSDYCISFNSKCVGILGKSKINVSKTNDFVIFREAQSSSSKAFAITTNGNSGFIISSRRIKTVTGLKDGQYFKLYSVKGGGYAIKRHEPIQVPD